MSISLFPAIQSRTHGVSPTSIVVAKSKRSLAKHSVLATLSIWVVLYPVHGHALSFASLLEKVKGVIFDTSSAAEEEALTNAQTVDVLKPMAYADYMSYEEASSSGVSDVLESQVGSLRLSTEDIVFPADDTISVYEVKKGDTLSGIAKLFGVSKNTIVWANDILANGALVPGMTLTILPVTGIKHAVKSGDTLEKLAKRYKADASDIAKYNGVAVSAGLALGDEIIIPDGEIVSTVSVAKTRLKKLATAPLGFFVKPMTYYRKTQGIHGHNAVDIVGSRGAPIVAVAKGRVVITRSSGYNGGYGSMVVIAHANGVQTLYAHLAQVTVSSGETVEQGQIIGKQGNTGRSTGHHLHLEVRGVANPF